ncbi:ComEC/Rec2 family competence protein [Parabacteroides sp. Marseille-P3160]|uniref:ComEC/Rec2 family competence protein n=1 Tax=Parabacteroides sp. Marseille-P3160 TaxID=1917887 RepID=UPI0009B9B7D5|nr:MBL fold metallo-hydrolase [Parabacteroides sp. Marseille-P3160]
MDKRILIICAFFFCTVIGVAQKANFVLWQLPSRINTIGNSYVFKMNNGKVIVMDGGVKEESEYLRGFLAALGNEVTIWFVTHPHPDHIGALTEILKKPEGITIHAVYHSAFSPAFCELEPDYKQAAEEFYKALKKSEIKTVDLQTTGLVLTVDKTKFKILGIKHEEIKVNPYNNSSMVIKVWDSKKSILFLADAGRESGELLLKGPYRKDLDCDYLQMAHHGQAGVSKDFYRTIKFKACLWPSPTWVYNNDAGKGFNTHTFETVEIRNLVDSLGIKKHYVSNQGLCKIE